MWNVWVVSKVQESVEGKYVNPECVKQWSRVIRKGLCLSNTVQCSLVTFNEELLSDHSLSWEMGIKIFALFSFVASSVEPGH
jgi:hypothetical protein